MRRGERTENGRGPNERCDDAGWVKKAGIIKKKQSIVFNLVPLKVTPGTEGIVVR